ncbi:hypothetical protein PHET_10313 [Paragonimus heterotremus]|uniref:Uncharacterized protein n=1 Tax=Paragonimus heterotremus TaxID=100268 RepID=A0A8J4SUT7_9TREM|nr:hypothetical protein PHET_10313 [Paragonimus heterotremus]
MHKLLLSLYQASDSVFSRLSGQTVSDVSATIIRRSLPESRDSPLSYAGVFKCPRIQPPSTSSEKKANSIRAKSASYTEGVLSSSLIARKPRRDIPVKRRLGRRVVPANKFTRTESSVHSRLGGTSAVRL